ncbi:MAG: DNA-directed RNA polymerase subunit K [Nanoarchaeota archaeon]|nr:DNA-directed RNA polymerase subunit K [Nanoarchaeota archaeon]
MKVTKYEKARIIGARALQIAMGAPVFIKLDKKTLEDVRYSSVEIAKREFENNLLPISIKRPLPTKA